MPHIGIVLALHLGKRLCDALHTHRDQIVSFAGVNGDTVASAIDGLLAACDVLEGVLEALVIVGQ